MTKDEALRKALDALQTCTVDWDWGSDGDEYLAASFNEGIVEEAIKAVKVALAGRKHRLTEEQRHKVHLMWCETDELNDEQAVIDIVEKMIEDNNR